MKDITVKPDISIRQAMKTLSQLGEKCLVIVNEKNHLLGTLSDGDLRKVILKGSDMGDSVENIYQQNPTLLVEGKYLLEEAKTMQILSNEQIQSLHTWHKNPFKWGENKGF